jgi:predicted dehydrogenase
MKIAIVGCGMISDTHIAEIRKIKGAKTVAVCDREPLMAEQLASRYNIPKYYSDIEKMLDQCKPHVVHIITPPATHLPLCLTALEAGCHILLEKPFTVYHDEAERIIEKAKYLNKKITVNHFHNFSPPSLRLRKLIEERILGEIIHIESFYSYSMQSPVATALLSDEKNWIFDLPGKLLQNNIDHLLCKIIQFIPDENPLIFAHGNRLGREANDFEHSVLHDELRVLIAGENISAYATFSSNIVPFQHFMVVYGSKKTVFVDYESRTIIFQHTSKIPGSPGKVLPPFNLSKQFFLEGYKNIIKFVKSDFNYYSGMNTLLRLFYNSIQNDTKVPIPYVDIIKIHKIMDEIFKKINQKHPKN